MPLRLDFFDEPMFRTTPVNLLNDPFEADVQHHQIIDILEHIDSEEGVYSSLFDEDEFTLEIESDTSESNECVESELNRLAYKLKNYGVVSFTEDYSNLLMWAHYASEHKGMVIELSSEVTWLKKNKSKSPDLLRCFNTSMFDYLRELPERIIYRAERPHFEFAIDVVHDFGESKILDNYFYSKGDNWMYEKEHRSILPLKFADKIITTFTPEIQENIKDYPSVTLEKPNSLNNSSCTIQFTNELSAECDDARMIISLIAIHILVYFNLYITTQINHYKATI